jgi:hypothetical protein
MIITNLRNDLFHVVAARLNQANGVPIRFFGTAGQVIAYLKENPDTDFLLEAVNMGRQLQGATVAQYSPANGDIFCGHVKFDRKSNSVICT